MRRVVELLKQGHVWVVDADIRAYFDSIDHGMLMDDIQEEVADGRVLSLIEAFLKAEVMGEAGSWEPERGTPQGGVNGGRRWPRRKSETRLRDAIRPHTRRANGNSLAVIIARINPILRGWFEYFKHAAPNTFPGIDGWVRMRLRSILRRRAHRRGRGRGSDHQRWPNAYFTAQGLFTMTEARKAALQPR